MLLRCFVLAAVLSPAAILPAIAQTSGTASGQTAPADTNSASPSTPPVIVPQQNAVPSTVRETPTPSEPATAPQSTISTGAQTVQTGGVKIHGTVTDPDGAIIPGATVTLTPAKGGARTAKSGADGTYSLTVNPGTYTMVVSMPGFASYSVTNLKVQAVPGLTLDAKLTVGETTQVINVEASAVQVSVDPDSNASSTVLTGKDLDALSDDPDELQNELTALAGPAAGPNGGQIYVDGFTGGQLPPKSSIREIRINQNPFSAQYDRLGFGRIEVFTKPGTDKFHGSFQMNGNASSFNTGNPLIGADVYQPPYHTLFMFGSLTGPINKWASFNIGGYHRDIEDDEFTNTTIYSSGPGSTTLCSPGQTGCSFNPVQVSTYYPQVRTEISPRIDLALGANNVLTTRFQYEQNDITNQGVGNLTLPQAGSNSSSHEVELQMSDTQTFGTHVIDETRAEYERDRAATTPISTAPTLSVSGVFSAGGYNGQNSNVNTDHWELQNYTSIQTRKNFMRLGGRLRVDREAESTTNGTNGAFTYAGLTSYQNNQPSQFTQTFVNNFDIHLHVWDIGMYAESDWKPLPNLTVSYGIRYEAQNWIQEHHDWAPRSSFAYGVGKSKTPKTVIRGGIGIFYDRFTTNYVLPLVAENGTNETVYTLNVPTGNPNNCGPTTISNCLAGSTTNANTIYTVPTGSGHMQHLTSPYILQEAIGADQQLGRYGLVSVNFVHSLGVHALAIQNIACNPDPVTGICQNQTSVNDQYLTEGQFHENQLTVNPKMQISKWLSLFGYYSLIYAYGDNSGASTFLSQPGNFHADLGPTSFDVRNRYFMAGSITLPRHIQVSPFMIGQSGSRFNITEGQDINHDSVFNDRPLLVAAGTPNSLTLPGCGTFLSRTAANAATSGGTIVPSFYCTGPALFTLNARVTKTWGFGGSSNPNAARQSGGGGGGDHHGGGGRGPGGGGPPGFFGGGGSTGQKYNFTLGAMVANLTNNKDLSTPIGTLTSPDFGKSLQLAGGPFTGANSLMRLTLQASFTF